MIGCLIGDIAGSSREFKNISNRDFEIFERKSTYTDDSILSIATADVLIDGVKASYGNYYLDYAKSFPNRGWGGSFEKMIKSGTLVPYNSYGNGAAMRVGPVGWVFDNIGDTLEEAEKSAKCSHNHSEGIKGAQAVALSTYLARTGKSKEEIKKHVEKLGYDLSSPLSSFGREFDETCQGTIPKCMAIFFETNDFEDAIRTSIASGGDVDTIACIVGGISHAYYGMPDRKMVEEVYKRLSHHLAKITTIFTKKYIDKDFIAPTAIATDFAANL